MNKEIPLVSIIATCYNHEKYCLEALDSLKNQTYKNTELIIIDDCSTDNTVGVIEKWIEKNNYDCNFIKHQKNVGLIKGANEGLEAANGLYYNFCSLDDIALPNKIEIQTKAFETNFNALLVISDIEVIDENSVLKNKSFIRELMGRDQFPTSNYIEEFFKSDYLLSPSYLCHSRLFDVIGEFDENLVFEDFDKKLAILTKEVEFVIVDKPTVRYRMFGDSMSNASSKRYCIQNLKTIKKYIKDPKVRPFLKSKLARFSRLLLAEEKSMTTLKWLFINVSINKNKKAIKLLAKFFLKK
ncbi:MAG: glycosyltransferase [Flavobacteriaceae bacterium]